MTSSLSVMFPSCLRPICRHCRWNVSNNDRSVAGANIVSVCLSVCLSVCASCCSERSSESRKPHLYRMQMICNGTETDGDKPCISSVMHQWSQQVITISLTPCHYISSHRLLFRLPLNARIKQIIAVLLCDWGVKADMVLFAGNTVIHIWAR